MTTTLYRYKYPHPAVAVDLVIFTLKDHVLQLLLIERGRQPFKATWALPGGFVRIDENLVNAAQRELSEETGLAQAYLDEVGAFGEVARDPRERVISVAFYAILASDTIALQAGSDARAVSWFALDALPPLAFDHHHIIAAARAKLSDKVNRSTVALEFLPVEFTLTELQAVFETVRGEPIDKRNFRKWAETLSFIKATGRTRRGGQHRPAALYRSSIRGIHSAPQVGAAIATAEAPAAGAASQAKLDAAYRKGYQDALGALHSALTDAHKSLLRRLSTV